MDVERIWGIEELKDAVDQLDAKSACGEQLGASFTGPSGMNVSCMSLVP